MAAEWLAVLVTQAGNAFDQGQWPAPSQFIAGMVVYMMLAGLSLAGRGPAKLAASMGGLVALYMLVVPPPGKSQSTLEGFFSWLANLEAAGIRPPQLTAADRPKKSAPGAGESPTNSVTQGGVENLSGAGPANSLVGDTAAGLSALGQGIVSGVESLIP